MVKGYRLQGEALAALGQPEEAVAPLTRAVDMAERLGNPPLLWKSRSALGNVWRQLGRPSLAQEQFRWAAELIVQTAGDLDDQHLRETFLAADPVRAILTASGQLEKQ